MGDELARLRRPTRLIEHAHAETGRLDELRPDTNARRANREAQKRASHAGPGHSQRSEEDRRLTRVLDVKTDVELGEARQRDAAEASSFPAERRDRGEVAAVDGGWPQAGGQDPRDALGVRLPARQDEIAGSVA